MSYSTDSTKQGLVAQRFNICIGCVTYFVEMLHHPTVFEARESLPEVIVRVIRAPVAITSEARMRT